MSDFEVHPIGTGETLKALKEALTEFAAARDAYLEADCDSRAESFAAGRLDAAQEVAERILAKTRGERA